MIDACIPPETKVEIWTRAANDKRNLTFTQWQLEPGLYLRASGSEIPFLALEAKRLHVYQRRLATAHGNCCSSARAAAICN